MRRRPGARRMGEGGALQIWLKGDSIDRRTASFPLQERVGRRERRGSWARRREGGGKRERERTREREGGKGRRV